MQKKKIIKWYNINFILLHVLNFILLIILFRHIDTLQRNDVTLFRLKLLSLSAFAAIYMSLIIIRKHIEDKKRK